MILLLTGWSLILITISRGQNEILETSNDNIGALPLLMPGTMCDKVGSVHTPLSDQDPCQKCWCSYGFVLCKKEDDCQSKSRENELSPELADQRVPKINQHANRLTIPPEGNQPPLPSESTNKIISPSPECFGEGTLPFREDKRCLDCECHNETVHCRPSPCPVLSSTDPSCKTIKKTESCCPELECTPSNPENDQTLRILPSAVPDDVVVAHPECFGEGALPPREDKHCLDCVCISGIVNCTPQKCPVLNNEQPNCKIVQHPGACCQEIECDPILPPAIPFISTNEIKQGPNTLQSSMTSSKPFSISSSQIINGNFGKGSETSSIPNLKTNSRIPKINHDMVEATTSIKESDLQNFENENVVQAVRKPNLVFATSTSKQNIPKITTPSIPVESLISQQPPTSVPLPKTAFSVSQENLATKPPLINQTPESSINNVISTSVTQIHPAIIPGAPCFGNKNLKALTAGTCRVCRCIKGRVKCIPNPCPPIENLPIGCTLQKQPGQCCLGVNCESDEPPSAPLHPNSLFTASGPSRSSSTRCHKHSHAISGNVGGVRMYEYPGSNLKDDVRNPVSRWRTKYRLPYREVRSLKGV